MWNYWKGKLWNVSAFALVLFNNWYEIIASQQTVTAHAKYTKHEVNWRDRKQNDNVMDHCSSWLCILWFIDSIVELSWNVCFTWGIDTLVIIYYAIMYVWKRFKYILVGLVKRTCPRPKFELFFSRQKRVLQVITEIDCDTQILPIHALQTVSRNEKLWAEGSVNYK